MLFEITNNFKYNMQNLRRATKQKTFKYSRCHSKSQKIPIETVGSFRIGELIGKGGFALVHKAYHIVDHTVAAVKIMDTETFSDETVIKLRRQVEIQSALEHPNIAKVYQVQEKDNKIYIFMEYIPSGQLFTYINQNGPLSQKLALKIFSQLLSAVCYLHEQQIIHRDIKPQNIILDENMNPKLIDFGLAKNLKNSLQKQGTICGSPSYCAPEMVKKYRDYDGKEIDVWCLGVTLYAMLEAALPFDEDDPKNLNSNILKFLYHPTRYCSHQSDELFSLIFKPESVRPTSKQLYNCTLLKKYDISPTHSKDAGVEIMIRQGHNGSQSRRVGATLDYCKRQTIDLKSNFRVKSLKKKSNPQKGHSSGIRNKKSSEKSRNKDNIFQMRTLYPLRQQLRTQTPSNIKKIINYLHEFK